jgi:hypothetical protein
VFCVARWHVSTRQNEASSCFSITLCMYMQAAGFNTYRSPCFTKHGGYFGVESKYRWSLNGVTLGDCSSCYSLDLEWPKPVGLGEGSRTFKKWSLVGGLLVMEGTPLKGIVGPQPLPSSCLSCPGHKMADLLYCTLYAPQAQKQWGQATMDWNPQDYELKQPFSLYKLFSQVILSQ